MAWGRVVLLLAALALAFGAAGFGAGRLAERDPTDVVSTPMAADRPATPQRMYRVDRDYPRLRPGIPLVTGQIGDKSFAWYYPHPADWRSTRLSVDEYRYRVPGAPTAGGYSMRVQLVSDKRSTEEMAAARLQRAMSESQDVTVLLQTDDELQYTFRDGYNRKRWNFFRWFAASPTRPATLELSVVGRRADVPGLTSLIARLDAAKEPGLAP